MKSMREMISLMEGVVAVPGLNEKSTSEKQARFMAAAAHDPKFAKKVGIDQDVAKEFNQADKGTKQLSNAMKHKTNEGIESTGLNQSQEIMAESVPAIDSCSQSNPENADVACAMEGDMSGQNPAVEQALAAFEQAVMQYGMEPENAYDRIIQNLGNEDLEAFRSALEAIGFQDVADAEATCNDPMDSYDMSDDAAIARTSRGFDEDYGTDMEFEEAFDLPVKEASLTQGNNVLWDVIRDKVDDKFGGKFYQEMESMELHHVVDEFLAIAHGMPEFQKVYGNNMNKAYSDATEYCTEMMRDYGFIDEAFDLQNGYDDINDASGNDYFPTGADSPVVRTTGPSGAHQGDNPEQKRMQVAEVHKELVYSYRSFLGEASKKKKTDSDSDKAFNYQEWKKSGKKGRASSGFGKNGFATKLMKGQDKK